MFVKQRINAILCDRDQIVVRIIVSSFSQVLFYSKLACLRIYNNYRFYVCVRVLARACVFYLCVCVCACVRVFMTFLFICVLSLTLGLRELLKLAL